MTVSSCRLRVRVNVGILILSFVGSTSVQAQLSAVVDTTAYRPGAIEGFVVNALTGKSIEGATIQVAGTTSSGISGAGGGFRLSNIFPGTRALTILAEGMRAVWVADIAVQPGRTIRLRSINLRPTPVNGVEELEALYINASQLVTAAGDYAMPLIPLAQVVVVPSHYAVIEDEVTAGSELSRQDLEILPQNGEDLYRAMTRLPGLATSDTATRFWVRGAPNDQVLTRFDGVELLEPFHIKGFDGALSIVDLETVSRLDLITGGFTAKYGDRMAGVLTMETESFDSAQPQNTLGASLTGARVINRGDFANGRGSWRVEGRVGYPGSIVGDAGVEGQDLSTRYSDFTAKIEYRLNPDQGLSLHFLNTRDKLRFKDVDAPYLESDYGSDYLWGRWRGKFGDHLYGETVLSLAYLSWRHRESGLLGGGYKTLLKDYRDLTSATLRQDWTAVISDRALVQTGFEYTSGESSYTYHLVRERPASVLTGKVPILNYLARNKLLRLSGQSIGAYFAPRIRVTSRLTIEPSIRFHHQDYTGDKNISPRFNASLNLGRTIVRGAWGLYYQPQGLHQLGITDEDNIFHPAERAEHRVISAEHRLVSGIDIRAEVYERLLSRIRPHSETLMNVDDALPEMKYDRLLQRPTKGVARGLELVVEDRLPGRFNWAVSYALAKTTETVDGVALPRPRDQHHTFALDLSYAPSPLWRISASWQYHTGWPTTDVTFSQQILPTGETVIVGNIEPSHDRRLPAYHRLDLRVTRLVYLHKTTLRIFADLFNAYNRKNIQGYDFAPALLENNQIGTVKKAQTQVSFTPNLGVVWEF